MLFLFTNESKIPFISKYSVDLMVSNIAIININPKTNCKGKVMQIEQFNNVKVHIDVATKIEIKNEGKISFICAQVE